MSKVITERLADNLSAKDAANAASIISDGATIAVSGFGGVGYPKVVPTKLTDLESLMVVSAGGVGGEIDDLLVNSNSIERRTHFQTREPIRTAINEGEIDYFDQHVSQFGDKVRFSRDFSVDVAIVEAVAAGEDWFIPSTSIGHVHSLVDAADQIITEVNYAQPIELASVHDIYHRPLPPIREPIPPMDPTERIGKNRVGFDPASLHAIVKTERSDDPYSFRDPTEVDLTIASHLLEFLSKEITSNIIFKEEVNIQFGVGSLGNALMGAFSDADFGGRDVTYFGEVFQDGLLDMIDENNLKAASATSLALSTEGQKRFFNDINRYIESVVLRPADISNNPALIDRFGVVGVNSAVEIDIYGNANATHISGSQMINGIGGGGDYVRNSPLSIITLPSTASNGNISRIVPMASHIDHTEHDISVVITEYGVADLRGLSPRERARKIINVADPSFRDDLINYLERAKGSGGHTPHDLETAFDWY